MNDFEQWVTLPIADIDHLCRQAAELRQTQLTKPAGSLGQLEDIAIQLAGMQGTVSPQIKHVYISIFAADHGIVAEGVSAFPQSVTAEMVRNFSHGGAAISVLAQQLDANLQVLNVGTATELEPLENVHSHRIANGTANFCHQAAMSLSQCEDAILIGRDHINQLKQSGAELFIGGEMGIGNTTSATAIACVLLKLEPHQITGPGTGLDEAGIAHKITIIKNAVSFHQTQFTSALSVLQHIGGFEIAALVGCYLQAAKLGLPTVIDGYISTVAALLAEHINPGSKKWFFYGHNSAEPGHRAILDSLGASPILDLKMRLGEGSGAATVVPLLKLSCALHSNMASFSEAAVSEKSS